MIRRKFWTRVMATCLVVLGCPIFSEVWADTLEPSCEASWHWSNPVPEGNLLDAAAFDGTTYVAAGSGGTIMTSRDAQHWTYQCLGSTQSFQGLAAGPGRFVAGSDRGSIWESPDGLTWTQVESDSYLTFVWGMTYGNGRYVAVGGQGNVSSSPDGIQWAPVISLSPSMALTSVTFGNGLYVATGTDGSVWTSPDAVQWSGQPGALTDAAFKVLFGGGQFLACGESGHIWTSPDGMNWTARTSGTTEKIMAAAWDGARFIAITVYGLVLTSSDGGTWTSSVRVGGWSVTLCAEFLGGQYFVMGGVSLLTSPDLRTWNQFITDVTGQQGGASLLNVRYGGGPLGGRFVVVGSLGSILASSDGVQWTAHESGTSSTLWGLAWAEGLFVATGTGGAILTSPDGLSWTIRNSSTSADLIAVVRAQSLWVAVGAAGTVLTSPDALTWAPQAIGTSQYLLGIAYGAGRFVAVGTGGVIYWSSDAKVWSDATSGTSQSLIGVAYGNGLFVAVGNNGVLCTSADGQMWTTHPSLPTSRLWCVTFTGSQFLLSSNDGPIYSSTDGLSWTKNETLTKNSVVSVCEAGGVVVAVGAADDIQVFSKPAIVLSPASLPSGTVGTSYSETLTGSGGTPPYAFALTGGSLPDGMSLTSGGVFSGTPATPGIFYFTVEATDAVQCTGSQSYSIEVVPSGPPPAVSVSASPLSGPAPLAVTFSFTASGGAPPYTYSCDYGDGSAASSEPNHIYTIPGTYTATLTVSDAAGGTAQAAVSITATAVNPPVVLWMTKKSNPFRIVARGANLEDGILVFIGDGAAAWSAISWKKPSKIVIKGGSALKAVVPKGTSTRFKFVNPDGGSTEVDFQWP